jgi:hypothetical protein
MNTYDVEFGPEGEEPVAKERVLASDHDEAMQKVMEPFKNDPRVCDANAWSVKVRRVKNP